MKNTIRKVLSSTIKNRILWKVFWKTVLRIADFVRHERIKTYLSRFKRELYLEDNSLMPISSFKVKNGPFKGLKYPDAISIGSTLYPKLLGSYEKEIQHIIENIIEKEITEVIDIGCAEGYYAIGFLIRIQDLKVYAYDINRDARNLCRRMARINGVYDKIYVRSICDRNILLNIPIRNRAFIISDCEGSEKSLFDEEVIERLQHHYFLIEVHDFIDISISSKIRKRFKETHNIHSIKSIDDIQKALTYSYEEVNDLDLATKKMLFAEHRPAIMEWLFMIPKSEH